jgi:hypothetical protein
MGIVGYVANPRPWFSSGAKTVGSLLNTTRLFLVMDLLSLPAAILAIQVVRRIQANQQQRYLLLEERQAKMPAPTGEVVLSPATSPAAGGAAGGTADEFPFLPPSNGSDPAEPPDDMPTPWLDKG